MKNPHLTKLTQIKRLGSIPACLVLRSYDVGVGKNSGHNVYFAWGISLSLSQAKHSTYAEIVELPEVADEMRPGQLRRNFAPAISMAAVAKLLPILVLK